jgi:hypothetical protein
MTWSTDKHRLDPGLTALALRGVALNGSGWRMKFIAEQKRRRRARRLWALVLQYLFLVALCLGVWWLAVGCTLSDCVRVGAAGWRCTATLGTAAMVEERRP